VSIKTSPPPTYRAAAVTTLAPATNPATATTSLTNAATLATSTARAGTDTKPKSPVTEITAAEHVNFLKGLLDRHVNTTPNKSMKNFAAVQSLSIGQKAETVQARADVNREAEKALAAIKLDVQSSDKWSTESIETWKRLFDEAAAEPNATESTIFSRMNAFGAAINEVTGLGSVGIALTKEGNVASYYMTLSKDKMTTGRNHLNVAAGRESPTVTRIGTLEKKK
jgi:hypothetical protein